jgi:hypothetical protein
MNLLDHVVEVEELLGTVEHFLAKLPFPPISLTLAWFFAQRWLGSLKIAFSSQLD